MTQPACATNRSVTLDSGERLHEWFGENGHYIEAEEQPDGSLEWMLVMPGWKPFHFITKAREACPTPTPAETSPSESAASTSPPQSLPTKPSASSAERSSHAPPGPDPLAAWREARGPSRGEVYSFEALATVGDRLLAEAERLRDLNARMGEGRTGWPIVHQMQLEVAALRKEIESERAHVARLLNNALTDSCEKEREGECCIPWHDEARAYRDAHHDTRRRAAKEGGTNANP